MTMMKTTKAETMRKKAMMKKDPDLARNLVQDRKRKMMMTEMKKAATTRDKKAKEDQGRRGQVHRVSPLGRRVMKRSKGS